MIPAYSVRPGAPGRNLQLDVLRGIAIFGVLARHLILFSKPKPWDFLPIRAGWAGVDLFFVLSGFLISGLLFQEFRRTGGIRFRRFAFRRALRIYPPLFVLVILTAALRLAGARLMNWREVLAQFLSDTFFLQSYVPGSWGHFWSLSVEEHFYVLLPLLLWCLMRRRPGAPDPFRSLPRLFLGLVLIENCARALTAIYVPFSWQTHLYPTHVRMDSLFAGVVLSYLLQFHDAKFWSAIQQRRKLLAFCAAVCIAPCFIFDQYDPLMYTVGYTSLYVGFALLLAVALSLPSRILLPFKPLAYIGMFSYSIYLWHIPWLMLISKLHLLSSALFLCGAIPVGIVMAKLIEVPVLKWRDRITSSGSASAPAAARP